MIFKFDEVDTSYIDTTTEQTAIETGLFNWVRDSEWLHRQKFELQLNFYDMPYEDQINALHYLDFFSDHMPEDTKQFGAKFVTHGYDIGADCGDWFPKFMETCYPTLSKIETALKLKEELNQPSKAEKLVSSINQDAEAPAKQTRSTRQKI